MLARFRYGGKVLSGTVDVKGGRVIFDGVEMGLKEIELLAPSEPSKIVCIGLNYREHARELNKKVPDEPIIFLKPPTAVISPGANIIYPRQSKRMDYEGELGVVISRSCKDVSARDADQYILGYTCFNDITARDLQHKDGQWTRAKSFDTFAPFGPWIAEARSMDLGNASILTRVNGEVKQKSNTSDLIFNVPKLIEFISGVMTLLPGDVIATGTPPGVGPVQKGDVIEVEIAGIGVLRNHVAP